MPAPQTTGTLHEDELRVCVVRVQSKGDTHRPCCVHARVWRQKSLGNAPESR